MNVQHPANRAMTGCVTFDGGSVALMMPILESRSTFLMISGSWVDIQSLPKAFWWWKMWKQLCAILKKVMSDSFTVSSDKKRIQTAKSNKKPDTTLAMNLFPNYFRSRFCTFRPVSLVLNNICKADGPWKKHMNVSRKWLCILKFIAKNIWLSCLHKNSGSNNGPYSAT